MKSLSQEVAYLRRYLFKRSPIQEELLLKRVFLKKRLALDSRTALLKKSLA